MLPAGLRRSWLGRWFNGDQFWAALAQRASFDPKAEVTLLGAGQKGQAYRVGDKVVKITTDEREARAMWHVAQEPDPAGNVVRVETVQRFGRHAVWAVVQELLDPPDPAWAQAAQLWGLWVKRRAKAGRPFYLTDQTITLFAWEVLGQDLTGQHERREVKLPAGVPEIADRFIEWLGEVAKYLKTIKLQFADLHAGNIMARSGHPVAIDLGMSQARPADIDVLKAAFLELAGLLAARGHSGP